MTGKQPSGAIEGAGKANAPRAGTAKVKAELRKAIRKAAGPPEVSHLNITAMLDIMTIILVFLLKSLGESSAAIPQSRDLELPLSDAKAPPTGEGIRVTISKSQLLVGDDRVVELPNRQSLVQSGVGAQHKPGPNDLYIVPLGNALQEARRLDQAVKGAGKVDPAASSALIIADKTTPFRLLTEVLYTLGVSEFGTYHLIVMQAPPSGSGAEGGEPSP